MRWKKKGQPGRQGSGRQRVAKLAANIHMHICTHRADSVSVPRQDGAQVDQLRIHAQLLPRHVAGRAQDLQLRTVAHNRHVIPFAKHLCLAKRQHIVARGDLFRCGSGA